MIPSWWIESIDLRDRRRKRFCDGHILIIEDDPGIATHLRSGPEREGYQEIPLNCWILGAHDLDKLVCQG